VLPRGHRRCTCLGTRVGIDLASSVFTAKDYSTTLDVYRHTLVWMHATREGYSRTPHILQACHMTAAASSAGAHRPPTWASRRSPPCNNSTCACEMCPLRSTLFLGCHPLASASLNGRPHRSTLNPSHFLLAAAVLPSIEGPLPPKTALGSAPTADQGSAICDRSLSSRGDGDGARAVDTTQRIPQRIPQ